MQPDHILIVDDDREIRELLGSYLEKNGLRVTKVESAATCARRWRTWPST
jgi:two-component system OmpR family response regulator